MAGVPRNASVAIVTAVPVSCFDVFRSPPRWQLLPDPADLATALGLLRGRDRLVILLAAVVANRLYARFGVNQGRVAVLRSYLGGFALLIAFTTVHAIG